MTDRSKQPVIFLVFANDREGPGGYLRNLPEEARRLRDVLQPAEQAGLCEVVVRQNSTAGDIFKVFQLPEYRNRIGVFHYGGHANGYQLLLESAAGQTAAADAGGLAKFLGQQQGLHLVFLNGCSTQQQTAGLLEANISAVISTSQAIEDQVAADFASQFYHALAGGASIRTSYNEAEASLQTAKGGNMRDLYIGDKDDSRSQLEADRWPWDLHLRAGSESADQWNLPSAVDNPLFGLPPLPQEDLPRSPYRHLNWFTREDAEVFFGRGHQIRELYDRLTAPRTAPIMLFYGQSGVGKSSILDAGLIPRLEQTNDVRYLRRTAGGLLNTLQLAFSPEALEVPIETAWRLKEEQTGKPLIVFLDQVEELYTRPIKDLPDELEQFLDVVKATFVKTDQRPRGKLVLGFRKEYLAELESQLDDDDYELPRTKVFLDSLDRRGIIEIVHGPTRSKRLSDQYGLTVEDGLAEIIADNLLASHDSAIAPTLQLLLTKMWTEKSDEHPHFSKELYQNVRSGAVLREFLNQQIAKCREQYPEAVDSGLLLDILAQHTTKLSTADLCRVEQLQQHYAHLAATLPDLLQQCQDLYLLTEAKEGSTKATRLAHDTLAPFVRERFEESDKRGQRARRILDNRSVDWSSGQTGKPLDEADLKVVEEGASGTRVWSEDEQRLLEASRDLRARLQRTRKSQKIAAYAATVIIVVAAGFAVWGWHAASVTERLAQQGRIDALVDSIFLAPPSKSDHYMKTLKTVSSSKSLFAHAIKQLEAKLEEPTPSGASTADHDALTSGKASIIVALARRNNFKNLWPSLKRSGDPALRSYLIDRLSETEIETGAIVSRLQNEQDPAACQALILSLGEFHEADFPSDERLIQRLVELYSDHPDPGVHAASEWGLQKWDNDQLKSLAGKVWKDKPSGERGWYIDSQGQTMVFLKGPVTFRMGSPKTETGRYANELPSDRTIDHSFAIAAKEVTVGQFRKFSENEYDRDISPEPDCPIQNVTWYDAARYCNWLTDEENNSRAESDQLKRCYEPTEKGMKVFTVYPQRGGYRLPTEAEWEYACRGGAASSYCFGEAKLLLSKYATYSRNSADRSWPVGSRKPNDFGIFDMHGSVYEWCLDEYVDPSSAEVAPTGERSYRGGSWFRRAESCRSAARRDESPDHKDKYLGFRVARSFRDAKPKAGAVNQNGGPFQLVALTRGRESAVLR